MSKIYLTKMAPKRFKKPNTLVLYEDELVYITREEFNNIKEIEKIRPEENAAYIVTMNHIPLKQVEFN